MAPGPQPGRQGGRGAVQGAGDRLFGAVRRPEAAPLRSLRRDRRRVAVRGDRRHRRGRILRCAVRRSVRPAAAALGVGARPALHAGAGLRGGGAGLREGGRVRAPRGLRGLQRHRRGRRQRGPGHLRALQRRGRDPQEGRLPVQPARLHGLRGHRPGAARALRDLRGRGAGRSRTALHGPHPARVDGRVDAAGAARGRAGAARRAAGRSARHRAGAPPPVLQRASRRATGTC